MSLLNSGHKLIPETMHSVYVTCIKDVELFAVVFVHLISYIAIDGAIFSPSFT